MRAHVTPSCGGEDSSRHPKYLISSSEPREYRPPESPVFSVFLKPQPTTPPQHWSCVSAIDLANFLSVGDFLLSVAVRPVPWRIY